MKRIAKFKPSKSYISATEIRRSLLRSSTRVKQLQEAIEELSRAAENLDSTAGDAEFDVDEVLNDLADDLAQECGEHMDRFDGEPIPREVVQQFIDAFVVLITARPKKFVHVGRKGNLVRNRSLRRVSRR